MIDVRMAIYYTGEFMNDYQQAVKGLGSLQGYSPPNGNCAAQERSAPQPTRLESLRGRLDKIHAELVSQNSRRGGLIDKFLGDEPPGTNAKEAAISCRSITESLDFMAEQIDVQICIAERQIERLNSL